MAREEPPAFTGPVHPAARWVDQLRREGRVDVVENGSERYTLHVASPSRPAAVAGERAARVLSDDVLAAELQRRGWIVCQP